MFWFHPSLEQLENQIKDDPKLALRMHAPLRGSKPDDGKIA